MRTKEEAHDYRYFPDPDLVPLMVDQTWLEEIKKDLPELPDTKRDRFVSEYGLPEYDADLLVSERQLADWFEDAVRLGGQPKTLANWIKGDFMRLLNEDNKSIEASPIKPVQLVDMLKLIEEGVISGKIAKGVFEEMYRTGKESGVIIKEKGLVQISDTGEIENIIEDVIQKNPKEVERFKAGEQKLLGFFVGQVMKVTKGKANPQMVNEVLRKKLS
jgi:aspartyl-tRNA(Asn)/glutamyl-tRNA(Gln) amidotransferase subunit B